MRQSIFFLLFSLFTFCSPKGPQTLDHPFIGKTKQDLITRKGVAKEIRIYGENEAHIYKKREEYYGKKSTLDDTKQTPKKVFSIEDIFYINKKGIIYKYQFWRKRVD